VESYIHRSGRTARRGKEGICVTLFTDKSERLIKNIEKDAKIYMKKLDAVDFTKKGAEKGTNERENKGKDEGPYRKENGDNNFKGEYEIYMKYLPTDKSEQDAR
jgi:superfamily II DNA/RNA helicase